FRFPRDVIAVAVRWYLRYALSYRDVEELLAERGVTVDHVTIYRWVRTVRAEVTDRMLIAGPGHLHAVLGEYAGRYNEHRPHRARNLRPPDHEASTIAPVTDLATMRIRRRKVLGGLIHEYQRAA